MTQYYTLTFCAGKEKLAEILDMNSTAAKELMTSFLSESLLKYQPSCDILTFREVSSSTELHASSGL